MTSVCLEDDLIAVLPQNGEPLGRVARELIVFELYRRSALSRGRAAELLGMPLRDFVESASRLGIPYFSLSEEEWDAEVARIRAR